MNDSGKAGDHPHQHTNGVEKEEKGIESINEILVKSLSEEFRPIVRKINTDRRGFLRRANNFVESMKEFLPLALKEMVDSCRDWDLPPDIKQQAKDIESSLIRNSRPRGLEKIPVTGTKRKNLFKPRNEIEVIDCFSSDEGEPEPPRKKVSQVQDNKLVNVTVIHVGKQPSLESPAPKPNSEMAEVVDCFSSDEHDDLQS